LIGSAGQVVKGVWLWQFSLNVDWIHITILYYAVRVNKKLEQFNQAPSAVSQPNSYTSLTLQSIKSIYKSNKLTKTIYYSFIHNYLRLFNRPIG